MKPWLQLYTCLQSEETERLEWLFLIEVFELFLKLEKGGKLDYIMFELYIVYDFSLRLIDLCSCMSSKL